MTQAAAISELVSAAEKLGHPDLQESPGTPNVRSLPQNLQPLMRQALTAWSEREKKYLEAVGQTKEEFLQAAKSDIEGIAPPKTSANPVLEEIRRDMRVSLFGEQNASSHTVPTVAWVNAFVWILPRADTENAPIYRAAGKLMAAIMFYEAKLKWPESVEKFRSLWLLAGDS